MDARFDLSAGVEEREHELQRQKIILAGEVKDQKAREAANPKPDPPPEVKRYSVKYPNPAPLPTGPIRRIRRIQRIQRRQYSSVAEFWEERRSMIEKDKAQRRAEKIQNEDEAGKHIEAGESDDGLPAKKDHSDGDEEEEKQ